jgi:hypothetical protein
MTRRRVLWIGVSLVALLGALWFWLSPERRYHAYVDGLRAAGEPVDYDGLVGAPPPVEEDGGPELAAATQWLKDNVTWERWNAVVGPWNMNCDETWPETIKPEERAELAKLLVEVAPYFDGLRRAAAKPRLSPRAGSRDEFGFPSPSLIPDFQQASRVLCAAVVALPDEAARVEAIELLLTLNSRAECATILEDMVAAALARAACAEVRRGLEHGRLDARAARSRLDPHLRAPWLARAPRGMRGDRVFSVQWYQAVLDGRWTSPNPTLAEKVGSYAKTGKAPPSKAPFGIEFDEPSAADVIQHCKALSAAMRVPVGPYPEYRKDLLAAVEPLHLSDDHLEKSFIVKRAPDILCSTDAATRLARVAMAACEFRAAHGDFPASLDELKPLFADGVPPDPYTEAPFVYEKTAAGVRIASLGRLPEEAALDDEMLRERVLVWNLKR